MELLSYLLLMFTIYLVTFLVYYLISKELKKRIKIREIEMEKESKVLEKESTKINNNETDDCFFDDYDNRRNKELKRNYYISIFLFIVFIALIILSILNGFKINYNKYLKFLYFIVPIISITTIFDAYEYYKMFIIKQVSSKK